MERRRCRAWLKALGVGLGLGPALLSTAARGQSGAGLAGAPASNPSASPYMNPFLNPYLSQVQTAPEGAALYFLATQQARGGLGSGKIGGPSAERPGRRSDPRRTGGGLDAGKEYPVRGGSNVPGAGAYRFFNRTAARSNGNAPEVGSYYNRQTRHFPGNGR